MLEQLSQLWGAGAYGLPALSSAIESWRSATSHAERRAIRIGTFSMEAPGLAADLAQCFASVILIERF